MAGKRILERINAADDADGGGMDCTDQCRDYFRNPRSSQTLGTSSDLLFGRVTTVNDNV